MSYHFNKFLKSRWSTYLFILIVINVFVLAYMDKFDLATILESSVSGILATAFAKFLFNKYKGKKDEDSE